MMEFLFLKACMSTFHGPWLSVRKSDIKIGWNKRSWVKRANAKAKWCGQNYLGEGDQCIRVTALIPTKGRKPRARKERLWRLWTLASGISIKINRGGRSQQVRSHASQEHTTILLSRCAHSSTLCHEIKLRCKGKHNIEITFFGLSTSFLSHSCKIMFFAEISGLFKIIYLVDTSDSSVKRKLGMCALKGYYVKISGISLKRRFTNRSSFPWNRILQIFATYWWKGSKKDGEFERIFFYCFTCDYYFHCYEKIVKISRVLLVRNFANVLQSAWSEISYEF